MRGRIIKLALGITTILLLGVLVTTEAQAYSQCYPSSGNCLTYANYYHTVTNHAGSYWDAGVRSYTASPTRTMDDIGYSYWTIREWCYSTLSKSNTYGGHVLHYTSSYWAASTRTKQYCSNPSQRLGESLGNHDFYDYPYSHLYPYSYKSGSIP